MPRKKLTTSVFIPIAVLLTVGAILAVAPSAYAEKTCIGACKNHHNQIDNSNQDNSVDNSVDSSVDNSNQDNSVDSHNIIEAPCTAPGAPGGTGGGGGSQGGTGGVGGAGGSGGCNRA